MNITTLTTNFIAVAVDVQLIAWHAIMKPAKLLHLLLSTANAYQQP